MKRRPKISGIVDLLYHVNSERMTRYVPHWILKLDFSKTNSKLKLIKYYNKSQLQSESISTTDKPNLVQPPLASNISSNLSISKWKPLVNNSLLQLVELELDKVEELNFKKLI